MFSQFPCLDSGNKHDSLIELASFLLYGYIKCSSNVVRIRTSQHVF